MPIVEIMSQTTTPKRNNKTKNPTLRTAVVGIMKLAGKLAAQPAFTCYRLQSPTNNKKKKRQQCSCLHRLPDENDRTEEQVVARFFAPLSKPYGAWGFDQYLPCRVSLPSRPPRSPAFLKALLITTAGTRARAEKLHLGQSPKLTAPVVV